MSTITDNLPTTLTDDQRRAVLTREGSLLVSAAAGAGKTTVLAERVAHLVCDLPAEQRCRVDQLLVVTFTEAAAREMRTRIAAAIQKRLDKSPQDAYLREQLYLLDLASISTIHGFCRSLLRRWFPQAKVDPQVEILDENDADLLAREVLDELFTDLLEGRHAAEGDFLELVDNYADGQDANLVPIVLSVARFLRSLADPEGWLKGARQRLNPDSPESFAKRVDECVQAILVRELDLQLELAEHSRETIEHCWPIADIHVRRAHQVIDQLSSWREQLTRRAKSWECVATEVREWQFPGGSRPKGLNDDEKRAYEAARKCIEDLSKKLTSRLKDTLCRFTGQEYRQGLERIAGPVNTLLSVVEEFGRRFQAAKTQRSVVDFEDLQRYAFELLSEPGRPDQPSDVARVLQGQYQHICVDEFQDVDPLQAAILRLISRESAVTPQGNLFAVGDVKQSIYRFRLAEPRLFTDREKAFAPEAGSLGQTIYLQKNFRSRGPVIDAINELFQQLMSESFGGTSYDDRAKLCAQAQYPADQGKVFGQPGVELHLLEHESKRSGSAQHGTDEDGPPGGEDADDQQADDEELEGIEREAFLIGRQIQEWLGKEDATKRRQVSAPAAGQTAGMRPIEYRDIVILLRAPSFKAQQIADTLHRMGIPVRIENHKCSLDSTEQRAVVSLLKVLDNQQQDVPLAAVLRNPLLPERLSENDLLTIRMSAPALSFHEAVDRYASKGEDQELRQRLSNALARLDRYRRRMSRVPMAQALWEIYEDTGYLAFVAGLPNGLQRRGQLLRLHQLARDFGRFSRQGLQRFLRFIEQIDESPQRALTSSNTGDQDVVRIMSVHHSKGLEFPVVVLPDLSHKFNLRDLSKTMLLDRELGLLALAADGERRIRYPTLASLMAVDRERHELLAEELRILYVALTRAREHLVLIGRAKPGKVAAWGQQFGTAKARQAPPRLKLETACSFLDWVAAAIGGMPTDQVRWHGEASPKVPSTIEIHVHSLAECDQWRPSPLVDEQRENALRPLANLAPLPAGETIGETQEIEDIILSLDREYPALELATVQARASVADFKERWDAIHNPEERKAPRPWLTGWQTHPTFLQAVPTSAAEQGSAMHRFLQHVDLARPCDLNDLRQQWSTLAMPAISEDSTISLEAAAWFFATELGQRLRRDRSLARRELGFDSRLSPDRLVADVRARDERDIVLVRGIADVVLVYDDGLEILDYKTDRIGKSAGSGGQAAARRLAERVDWYRPQLNLYADALSAIFKRPVRGRWLIFLEPQIVVDASVSDPPR